MAGRVKGNRKRKRGMRLIAVFVICILCAVGYKSLGLAELQQKKESQLAAINAKIEAEEQRTTALEQMKAYVQTKDYIADVAKRYLDLVYPDDVILKSE